MQGWSSLDQGTALAGILGAVVSWTFIKNLNNKQAAMVPVVGAAVSYYTTPIVIQFFPVVEPVANSIAFFLGLAGMGIAGFVFWIFEDPKRLFELLKKIRR